MSDTANPANGEQPEQVCDIVLKGGITSGVVYPLALTALAEKYRFASIGGTSAGAIGAAAAAAAEYGRPLEKAGFERLKNVPSEVGTNLLAMFQPTPALRPILNIFVAALRAKSAPARLIAALCAAVKGYWLASALGALPGLIIMLLFRSDPGLVLFGLLAALVGLLGALVWRLIGVTKTDLVASDFGLCPGIRQPYAYKTSEGFTDWLARLIDEAAGRKAGEDAPLTFGDLAAPPGGRKPIRLAMMTTSLMERRPYTLPFSNKRFFFECGEFEKLFPARIVKFLTDNCEKYEQKANERGVFYHFPDEATLPLVVAARMSLSFPGLISAVPLWVRDFTLTDETEKKTLRRCLFSDGGLSSNFPIHFFDRLLPNHPTFAITLGAFNDKRNRGERRVWMPLAMNSGTALPIEPFDGLFGFLMRLLDSAKDWQDNLQSTLPGYHERIVHVDLKADEGGLNLTMDEATIAKLVGYGKQAGEALRDQFDLDAHRRRRFLVAMARLEETLDNVTEAYDGPQSLESFRAFLAHAKADDSPYPQSEAVFANMLKRGEELAAAGQDWRTRPTIRDGYIPQPATDLRITPKP